MVATHDADVIAIADRVLYLDRGRVVDAPERRASERRAVPAGVGRGRSRSVRGVGKSFRPRLGDDPGAARRDARAAPRRGRASLLGRSGSGKSTLLTLLAGWQTPDAGEIRYEPAAVPAASCRGASSRSCRSASACCPSCRCARTSSTRRGSRASSRSGASGRELLARARPRRARRPPAARDVDRPAAAHRARPRARAAARRAARRRADLAPGRRLARPRLGAARAGGRARARQPDRDARGGRAPTTRAASGRSRRARSSARASG